MQKVDEPNGGRPDSPRQPSGGRKSQGAKRAEANRNFGPLGGFGPASDGTSVDETKTPLGKPSED